MKILKEKKEYGLVMLGGSIGEKPIRSVAELKGKTVVDPKVFPSIEKAKENAKRMNGYLSPGEKKYYGLKYVVAEIEDGKYTGK